MNMEEFKAERTALLIAYETITPEQFVERCAKLAEFAKVRVAHVSSRLTAEAIRRWDGGLLTVQAEGRTFHFCVPASITATELSRRLEEKFGELPAITLAPARCCDRTIVMTCQELLP